MKKTEAYFTVEAALVMPMVLGVILFVIYLFFFQYDRCLLEQNVQALAMRGCTMQIKDRKKLAGELLMEARSADPDRYLTFETEEAAISMKGNKVTVQQSGAVRFPFSGFLPGTGELWKTEVRCVNDRISPANFVRNCRKIMGGK